MDTVHVVLVVLVVIYIFVYMCVKRSNKIQKKGISAHGPAIIIKTKLGIRLIDRLSKWKVFWRVCGVFSRVVSVILMVCIISVLIINLSSISAIVNTGIGIEYAFAIPGINPMLPLTYGGIALVTALIVHEVAHGIQARANDVEVKSTGVICAVVPVGAFVEPNEEQVRKCSRRVRIDIYAAGITANFVTALISFVLLFLLMSTVTSGYDDSPAVLSSNFSTCGDEIPTSAIITQINGRDVSNYKEFISEIIPSEVHKVTYVYQNTEWTRDVRLGLYVESVIEGSPVFGKLKSGDFIERIENISNGTFESFRTLDGFIGFIDTTSPGDRIKITFLRDDDHDVAELYLGEKGGIGYIGIISSFSGYSWVTPEILANMGINPYCNCSTLWEYGYASLSYVGNAFQGFAPVPTVTQWWFHGVIPGDIFWVVVQMLYWIFWINMALGITNAVPAVPFDGGFLFVWGVDWFIEKLGVDDEKKREVLVNGISSVVTYVMLLALFMIMAAIIF